MTNEEAAKMLTAKAECMKRESSGEDLDCNHRNCDECELCYAQGTTGEQREALKVAIEALQNSPAQMTGTSDLISKQAVIDLWEQYRPYIAVKACEYDSELRKLPSAQPKIIHCRDCKHHHRDGQGLQYCDRIDYGYGWKDEDFCSRAERRKDG